MKFPPRSTVKALTTVSHCKRLQRLARILPNVTTFECDKRRSFLNF